MRTGSKQATSAVDRGWARTSDGKIVRLLWVNRYDQDGRECRSLVYRLDNNDKRPRGRQYSGHSQSFNDFLGTLPRRQWTELHLS